MVSTTDLETHCKDGWWPYFAGRDQSLESTVWCAIACRNNAALANKSVSYLIGTQLSDGGWSTEPDAGRSDWSTALALFALNVLSDPAKQLSDADPVQPIAANYDRAMAFLLHHRSETYNDIARFLVLLWNGAGSDYPHGWPWSQDTYHWVQPTAFSIMALQQGPYRNQARVRDAVESAQNYLIKISCVNGGWNYGCRNVLDLNLDPTPIDTAIGLLAMQTRGSEGTVRNAIKYLGSSSSGRDTLLTTAWTALALDAFGHDISPDLETVLHLLSDDRQHNNLATTALGTIAANIPTHGNPFKLRT